MDLQGVHREGVIQKREPCQGVSPNQPDRRDCYQSLLKQLEQMLSSLHDCRLEGGGDKPPDEPRAESRPGSAPRIDIDVA